MGTNLLVLKANCSVCRSSQELYGSQCKHLTLCLSCAKTMVLNRDICQVCRAPLSRVIREYNIRKPCTTDDKNYFIGKFGDRPFPSKRKHKWSFQKEDGRFTSLKDETVGSKYQVQRESQSSSYFALMMHDKDYVAISDLPWYKFNKLAKYENRTLEETEKIMDNLNRKSEDNCRRWMRKLAGNNHQKDGEGDDSSRKNRLDVKKEGREDDHDDDRGQSGDLDLDDVNIEKNGDWEYEEVFTDDDEAIDPLSPENNQDGEEKKEKKELKFLKKNENKGGLSDSGKELKKLLGKNKGLDQPDDDDDSDGESDDDEEDSSSRYNSMCGIQNSFESLKGKRKTNGDDKKVSEGPSIKKVKTEYEVKSAPSSSAGTLTEEEIRDVFKKKSQVTMKDLMDKFRSRFRCKADKSAFANILLRIAKRRQIDGAVFLVLTD